MNDDLRENMYSNWLNSLLVIFENLDYNGIDVIESDNLKGIISTVIPSQWFNGIFEYSVDEIDEKTVDKTNDLFESKNIHNTWYIVPFKSPSNLEDYLVTKGYKNVGADPHMFLKLTNIDISSLEKELDTSNLAIQLVDQTNVNDYNYVLFNSFSVKENLRDKFSLVNSKIIEISSQVNSYNYVGYVDKRPVCSSTVFYHSGVAGIYNIATVPAYRKRGLARLMTIDVILKAHHAGYEYSILQASPMGKPVYEKIGFETVFEHKMMMN